MAVSRRAGGALLAVAVAVATAACTGGSGGTHEGLPAGHGGTLRVLFTPFPGNPALAGDYDPQIGDIPTLTLARCCLFRTLLSYSGRSTEQGGTTPRPDLAAGLPRVSGDGLTWTFTLKHGLHYAPPFQHREIVGQDVIRGIERGLAPLEGRPATTICGGPPCQLMSVEAQLYLGLIRGAQAFADGKARTITGLRAPGPSTVRIELTRPSGALAYLVSSPTTSPIPPKPGDPAAPFGAAQGHDLNYGRGFAVASGPYTVEGSGAVDYSPPSAEQRPASGVRPHSLTLVRNPAWDPSTDDLRVAYPDRIVVTDVKDLSTGERLVRHDRADLVGDATAPVPLVERFRDSPELRDRVHVGPYDVMTVLTLNTAVPPLDDLHVRRAINFAIDKIALQGFLARFTSLGDPATHVGLDSLEDGFLVDYAPYGDGSGDLHGARLEMAESGYDANRDGRCDAAACRRVELIIPSDDPGRARMAQTIATNLAPIGIDVRVRPVGTQPVHGGPSEWVRLTTQPSSHVPLNLVNYVKGFPTGSDFYPGTFGSRVLSIPFQGDPSLLGASASQLRDWGYTARRVPSVDGRMEECDRQIFQPQVRCWVGLDQYLTERVVPWAPLLAWTGAVLVSSRVETFSWDQSIPIPGPAFDRIRLRPAAS